MSCVWPCLCCRDAYGDTLREDELDADPPYPVSLSGPEWDEWIAAKLRLLTGRPHFRQHSFILKNLKRQVMQAWRLFASYRRSQRARVMRLEAQKKAILLAFVLRSWRGAVLNSRDVRLIVKNRVRLGLQALLRHSFRWWRGVPARRRHCDSVVAAAR